MNIHRNIFQYALFTVLLLGGVLYSARIAAQQTDTAWWNMEYIRNANPWLGSGNAAGLKYLPVNKISVAEIYANKSDGKFLNFYQSDNSFTYGASTESYYRLNPKTVFQGKVAYANFNGKNMGGSAFINPYKNPLDIDEYADSTNGTKKLESYNLMGGVSVQISPKWTLGGKVNYEAANYAKMKDMRHVNKLLDLDASAGATYVVSNTFEIGASYDYIRRIESVVFNTYGNRDQQYLSLINYGAFYGIAELHTTSGYTSANTPMVNNTNKASLQLNVNLHPGLQLFNEFFYGARSGYFGKRGSSNIVYTEHTAKQYGYDGVLSLKGRRSLQTITLEGDYEKLKNRENIYRPETSPGGNTAIVYYGQTDVLNQNTANAGIEYAAYLHVDNNNPLWTFKGGGDYYRREQTVIRYPFYREQTINSYHFHLFGKRNIVHGKNMYGVSLDAAYGSGSGTAKNDGVYATPSSAPPASRDIYLYQEYEYFTKPRVKGEIGLQYSRAVEKQIAVYLKLNYAYTKAFNANYLGNYFNAVNCTFGCNF